jgi:hypothetical protein
MATLIQTKASNVTAPTPFVPSRLETYAYRHFGRGSASPLLGPGVEAFAFTFG